ncbi:unannotated protein [freshwater metagenome]|uniref:Unannotated protein n=1 Tax=freshwater metagenome TaxID=449393 RepID=A0A6J6YY88_9ZZZZ
MAHVSTVTVLAPSLKSMQSSLSRIPTSVFPKVRWRRGRAHAPSILGDFLNRSATSMRSTPMLRSTTFPRSSRNFCCTERGPLVGSRFATKTVMAVNVPMTRSSKVSFRGCSAGIPMPKAMRSVNRSRATCARFRVPTARDHVLLRSASASRSMVIRSPRSVACRLAMPLRRSTD